jgi:two-component system, chemotaxis family, protein-glutamate methylesterase/glutaminase
VALTPIPVYFQDLPVDMSVAVVIVNHLRIVASRLHEILPRCTEMPVELITGKISHLAQSCLIIPARCDLHVPDGEFRLRPISKPRMARRDHSLSALSHRTLGRTLIAVIVSGYDGGGGAVAPCGIKEVRGIMIAQKLDTAAQPDHAGKRNRQRVHRFYILSPEGIAQEIVGIAQDVSRTQ